MKDISVLLSFPTHLFQVVTYATLVQEEKHSTTIKNKEIVSEICSQTVRKKDICITAAVKLKAWLKYIDSWLHVYSGQFILANRE